MFGKEPAGRLVSRWTEVNGLRLHALVSANKPRSRGVPVVLVPGLNCGSLHQALLGRLLAPDFKVYSPDLPGYGLSQRPKRLLSITDLTDWTVAWMRAEGIERAVMLGTSFSAQIVCDFAVRYPQMVTRAIMISPEVDPKSRFLPKLLWLWWVNHKREPKYVGPLTAQSYRHVSMLRAIYTFFQMMGYHIEDHAAQIQAPTMVVHGARDALSTSAWAKRVADLIPCAWLVEIPGAAHAVNLDSPRKLAVVVRAFIAIWRMGRVGWRMRRAALRAIERAEYAA